MPLEKGGVLGMGELLDIARCLEIAKDAIAYDAKFEDLKDALSGALLCAYGFAGFASGNQPLHFESGRNGR